MMKNLQNGAFSHQHAQKRIEQRRWRLDAGLLKAIAKLVRIQGFPFPHARPSMIDLGAGIGHYTNALNVMVGETIATAVDAIPEIESLSAGRVQYGDLTDPTLKDKHSKCDWCLCLEVAEHIPASATDRLVENVSSLARTGIIISWAAPGQPGEGHINCRTRDDVRRLFAKHGWEESACESLELQQNAEIHWFQRNLMVLRKRDPKLFCIGLSKTGTASLVNALGILGYRIADWPHDPVTRHQLQSGDYRLKLLEADGVDGISNLQAAAFFREYFHCWPDSRFILTTQTVDEHLRQVQKHFESGNRCSPKSFQFWLRTAMWGTGVFEWNRFRRVYLSHNEQVCQWFSQYGATDRLLTFPLCEQDGAENWEPLCQFLGHESPRNQIFPRP